MNTVPAEPYAFEFDPATTALVIIDMQRDFVEPGGFGETLGNDVSHLQAVVPPLQKVLAAVREAGIDHRELGSGDSELDIAGHKIQALPHRLADAGEGQVDHGLFVELRNLGGDVVRQTLDRESADLLDRPTPFGQGCPERIDPESERQTPRRDVIKTVAFLAG